jgi:hypothetical protein
VSRAFVPSAKPKPRRSRLAALGASLAAVAAAATNWTTISAFAAGVYHGASYQPPVALVFGSVRPLDGYNKVDSPDLPSVGSVYPEGFLGRLSVQLKEPSAHVEVERLYIEVERLSESCKGALVDFSGRPVFGGAELNVFYVTFDGAQHGTVAVDNGKETIYSNYPDLIPPSRHVAYRLDAQNGKTESFDVIAGATSKGLYKVKFVAALLSDGRESRLESEPVHVCKN